MKPEWPFTVGPQQLAAVARVAESEGHGSLLAPEPIRIWEARSYDLNLWTERKRIEKLVFYPRLQ